MQVNKPQLKVDIFYPKVVDLEKCCPSTKDPDFCLHTMYTDVDAKSAWSILVKMNKARKVVTD